MANGQKYRKFPAEGRSVPTAMPARQGIGGFEIMSLSMSSSSDVSYYDILPIFMASLRSVGTAFTLAAVGIYLHQRGYIIGDGKKTLALIAQQVTIPALLFTKILYCNQDWSIDPCPSVTDSLKEVWMLLFWPIYVVGWGLLVGYWIARVTSTPPQHVPCVLVSCAFANGTGVPITLLSVIRANFPSDCELGRIDPTLFLSVYLILYPILQWGIGGFLLAPTQDGQRDGEGGKEALIGDVAEDSSMSHSTFNQVGKDLIEDEKKLPRLSRSAGGNFGAVDLTRNVLNNKCISALYQYSHRGMQDTDASMYVSNTNLVVLPSQVTLRDRQNDTVQVSSPLRMKCAQNLNAVPLSITEHAPLLNADIDVNIEMHLHNVDCIQTKSIAPSEYQKEVHVSGFITFCKILSRCLQPPVIGALSGIFVASIPMLRGLFVDTVHRAKQAAFQWLFDALYFVGQSAVPINMIILGSNLSSSHQSVAHTRGGAILPTKSIIGIVIGKMVILPIIGVLSCVILKNYFWSIPADIDAPFYLVAMIVFITPTGNNLMVMVELSGCGSSEGMARSIGYQFAVSPILLSLSVTAVVAVASAWMHDGSDIDNFNNIS